MTRLKLPQGEPGLPSPLLTACVLVVLGIFLKLISEQF